MALNNSQIESLASGTSLSAVSYQAASFLRELERINSEEYLPEACKIKEIFGCIGEYVSDELWAMYDPSQPYDALNDSDSARTRALARIIHQLYSFLRYLWASSPHQSPPGIQSALNLLTKHHFPTQNGIPTTLVRPQWKYNLTYVSMTWILRNEILLSSVLDPDGKLGASDADGMLRALWTRHLQKLSQEEQDKLGKIPPQQVAILSFAGLDTNDTLLYPLLAHELGHFIDFSYTPPLNVSPDVATAAQIKEDEVRGILEKHLGPSVPAKDVTGHHNLLVQRVFVALREILADLIATRMAGFGYFAAHSEFLKTLAAWPQPTITNSGYPGIKYRLSLVLKHLFDPSGCGFRDFIDTYKDANSAVSNKEVSFIALGLDAYLAAWENRVNTVAGPPPTSLGSMMDALNQLVVRAVENAHSELVKLAAKAIPPARCAQMTSRFFDRIQLLREHLPPSCPGEEPGSFAEIAAAGWGYQILFGEEKERTFDSLDGQNREYQRICRLSLKAIELIPTGGGDSLPPDGNDIAPLSKIGTLSGPGILERAKLPLGHKQRLSVIPFTTTAANGASLDVHLGNWLVTARRTRLSSVELENKADEWLLMTVGREEAFVPSGHTFLIHPGDLVLGTTLEFLALPPDLMAFVEGRSGLGRMGLLVATATQIAPGFHGVVILELANTGTVPLKLVPGMPIAQLVFQVMSDPVPEDLLYRGKYYCQVKP